MRRQLMSELSLGGANPAHEERGLPFGQRRLPSAPYFGPRPNWGMHYSMTPHGLQHASHGHGQPRLPGGFGYDPRPGLGLPSPLPEDADHMFQNNTLKPPRRRKRTPDWFLIMSVVFVGLWTDQEHELFLDGLRTCGRGDWRGISALIKTRTPTQVASHAQKYFLRLAKSGGGSEPPRSVEPPSMAHPASLSINPVDDRRELQRSAEDLSALSTGRFADALPWPSPREEQHSWDRFQELPAVGKRTFPEEATRQDTPAAAAAGPAPEPAPKKSRSSLTIADILS